MTSAAQCGESDPDFAPLHPSYAQGLLLCGGLPSHLARKRHWLVGALQELDGHEDHLLVPEILKIMDLELTGAIGLVAGVPPRLGVFDGGDVLHVLRAAASGT